MYTIDIETRSDKDISKCGVYAYTDTPYFDILLFAYSVDGQPVQVVNMANDEEIPENILAALADENVVKRAFNCNFERIDILIGTNYIRDAVCISFCLNELLSIIENTTLMGIPFPPAFKKAIDVLQNKVGRTEDEKEDE